MYSESQIKAVKEFARLHEVVNFECLMEQDCIEFLDWYLAQKKPSSMLEAKLDGLINGAEKMLQQKSKLEVLVAARRFCEISRLDN